MQRALSIIWFSWWPTIPEARTITFSTPRKTPRKVSDTTSPPTLDDILLLPTMANCLVQSHRPPSSVHFGLILEHPPQQIKIPQDLSLRILGSPQYACTN
ncbi:hypothetical protein P171DRAFT_479476 [Karstenula rhodostoma CBS 690.94]|uniref:Uncharacterized protein n=1 Tax=Karstenula rhodostoma CBS 690.94 TaxID=1392251 RepID=A0A9P4PS90_9PLEO|nr:hypothetical protein P171DRAFT_479476 [Karstenula rhodostoma CBS 690.94]